MKDKKNIAIACIFIVIIGTLLAIFFNKTTGNGLTVANNETNNIISNSTENEMTILPLEKVTNYQQFFTINDIINEYYQNIINQSSNDILNKLDSEYIEKYNIDINNIISKESSTDITYNATDMYVKGINSIYYYFVEGSKQVYNSSFEMLIEDDAVTFLIIVDNDNMAFTITPIEITSSLEVYADTYKMNKAVIEKNDYNSYTTSDMTDERITKYYLNYYKNLLYLNTEKAYNMLSDETKVLYPTLESFNNNLNNIYSNIKTNIVGYEVKGESGKRSYYSLNNNQVRITMIESSIMNFSVTIEQ